MELKRLSNIAREQFFELIRLGLQLDQTDEFLLKEKVDWKLIYSLACEQTLVGVIFDGIQCLPNDSQPAKPLLLQWLAHTISIEKQNHIQETVLILLLNDFKEDNIESVLLKGQGCAWNYPNYLHRQSGDIDLYVGTKQYDRAKKSVINHGMEISGDSPKDFHFFYQKVMVECHQKAAHFYNKRLNTKLQEILQQELVANNVMVEKDDVVIKLPNPTCNVFYLFVHFYHHFIQVGVGLRQICDWVLLVQKEQHHLDWDKIKEYVETIEAKRAFVAFYNFAKQRFALHVINEPMWLTTYKESDVIFIENDIFNVGNMGHNSASMRHRYFGKGLCRNICSYFFLGYRLCHVLRFGHKEVVAYPLYKIKS